MRVNIIAATLEDAQDVSRAILNALDRKFVKLTAQDHEGGGKRIEMVFADKEVD